MVFSSVIFLCLFLPIVLGGYYLLPKREAKNLWLIAASLLFYAFSGLWYVLLLLFFRILQLSGGPVCFRAEGSTLRCSGGQSGSFGCFQIPDISGEDGGSAAGRGDYGIFYRSTGGHLVLYISGFELCDRRIPKRTTEKHPLSGCVAVHCAVSAAGGRAHRSL